MPRDHKAPITAHLCSTLSLLLCNVHDSKCSHCIKTDFNFSPRKRRTTGICGSIHHSTQVASSTAEDGQKTAFELRGRIRSAKKRAKSCRWLHDSGASMHCCNDISKFHSITDWAPNIELRVANNKTVKVSAIGNVVLRLVNQHGVLENYFISNVCYVPSFHNNILSVSRLYHENRLKTSCSCSCGFGGARASAALAAVS